MDPSTTPTVVSIPQATVTRRLERYPVHGATQPKVWDEFFGGRVKPLCTRTNVKGCENAVAATSWQFDMPHGPVYDEVTGKKREPYVFGGKGVTDACACNVHILLPKWEVPHGTEVPASHARGVGEFIAATATHERGHGAACKSLAAVVLAALAYLPEEVPPGIAPQVNGAFGFFVKEFYEPLARRADRLYDRVTYHGGGAQHAELSRRPRSKHMDTGLSIQAVADAAEARGAAAASRGWRRRGRSVSAQVWRTRPRDALTSPEDGDGDSARSGSSTRTVRVI